jgi:fucose 4-O-acetylase-like acetyltransferase
MTTRQRLFFFDNLRIFAMAMVIAHHAAQPYGPTGGEWPITEPVTAAILGPFFMVNRSFGMSLFFMIAGYFTVMSCDRYGPRAFLNNRLARLGIPLLVFVLIMMALQVFVFGAEEGQLGQAWPVNVAHMWFVEHLIVYSIVYALWRMIRPRRVDAVQKQADPPGYGAIVAVALGLAVVTGVVRIWYPIDEWVTLFGFLRVAWGDVPRDLCLFIVGLVAYRHQWATRFPTRAGMVWLGVGLSLAAFWYVYDLWLNAALNVSATVNDILVPFWESFLCFGMCIGLTVLFRERANIQTRLTKWLADAQYATYIIHVFPVLAFQALLVGLAAPPLAKFALVTLASIPVAFLIGGLIRKPLRL